VSAALFQPISSLATAPAAATPATGQATAAEAQAFERLLVGQLAQQLASSAGLTGSGDDASGGGTAGDQALAAFVPQALTDAVMADGGLGIAASLAPAAASGAAATTVPPAAAPAGGMP
jgi:hypothetical protein